MNVIREQLGDVLVVCPQGKLDGDGAKTLQAELDSALAQGEKRFLFDFAELVYISSSGLRVILAAAKQAQARSGAIALCSLNENIRKIFDMSGFNTILDIGDDRDQAVAAFF